MVLNPEEKNFLAFLEGLETKQDDPAAHYSVSVNIEIKFTCSKAKDALGVQVTNNPNAPEVRMTEEQVREKYPWDYDQLTAQCRKRYKAFKAWKICWTFYPGRCPGLFSFAPLELGPSFAALRLCTFALKRR